ncbi:MAG: DUF998 domain-containing protein [Promethearchaeota archaeon]
METFQFNLSKVQKSFALFGICGPVINAIVFTVLGLIYPGYNPFSQVISELASPIAPHGVFMNIFGFNIFGLYVILFGIGLYIGVRKHLLTRVSLVLFLIAGTLIFFLSIFPVDPLGAEITILGFGHNVLAGISSGLIPMAMIVLVYPLRKDGNWKGYWWFFFVLFGLFLLVYIPISMTFTSVSITGLVQRMGLAVMLSWIFLMSTKLYRLADKDILFESPIY